jgi:hypothetical protein
MVELPKKKGCDCVSENKNGKKTAFGALTKWIPEIEATENFDGETMFGYAPIVNKVYRGARELVNTIPECERIVLPTSFLFSQGIDWRELDQLDVSQIKNPRCILALVLHIFAQERFGEGYVGYFFSEGYVLRWLKRLQELDWEIETA